MSTLGSVSRSGPSKGGKVQRDEEDDADIAEGDNLRILNALTRNPGKFSSEEGNGKPVSAWLKSAEYVLRASYGKALTTLPFERLYPAIAANLDQNAQMLLEDVNPATWADFRREMKAHYGKNQEQIEAQLQAMRMKVGESATSFLGRVEALRA